MLFAHTLIHLKDTTTYSQMKNHSMFSIIIHFKTDEDTIVLFGRTEEDTKRLAVLKKRMAKPEEDTRRRYAVLKKCLVKTEEDTGRG